ncbi:endolytic transglycosylase MltG [Salinibius halmophilus]|uniref:endolytic transglycosylase MltG n=1 Tax=Salinibius halmophilus TaxID=1853216 RepID=UPI000E6739B9|nr:endolytic transglycosylase MltG [Salinibius halmophilus]
MVAKLFKVFAVLFTLLLVAGGAGYWYVANELARVLPIEEAASYSVPRGQTVARTVYEFEQKGWVSNHHIWRLWWQFNERSYLHVGRYEFEPGITVAQALAKMERGDVELERITFAEGLTVKEWLALLNEAEDLKKDIELTPEGVAELLAIEGNPEGWLFPDTYRYAANTTVSSLLLRAKEKMQQRLDAAWAKRPEGLPLASPYEMLTLASIIEKETGQASDRPIIASVFINRLNIGMRLQTDPTVIYGLGDRFDGDLRRSHLRERTAYNTYVINGLPPTPIANPGLESIDAVINAAQTDYLYFVARGDGSSQFSTNLADHNAAVRKYQLGQ